MVSPYGLPLAHILKHVQSLACATLFSKPLHPWPSPCDSFPVSTPSPLQASGGPVVRTAFAEDGQAGLNFKLHQRLQPLTLHYAFLGLFLLQLQWPSSGFESVPFASARVSAETARVVLFREGSFQLTSVYLSDPGSGIISLKSFWLLQIGYILVIQVFGEAENLIS